jgi:hypothetical protein
LDPDCVAQFRTELSLPSPFVRVHLPFEYRLCGENPGHHRVVNALGTEPIDESAGVPDDENALIHGST